MTHHIKIFVAAALLFFSAQQSKGFALLGPFADWMQPTNGFYPPHDIGGPMDLGEEYRWNVPLLAYGFDQSFLDYFGSNGVAAVEQAIQVLNDLPPASSMNLEDYSTNLPRMNPSGEIQQWFDLKTATLSMMLEQLGLGQPTRNVFILRKYDPFFEIFADEFTWPEGTIPTNILERNFDPESLVPSHVVNDSLFTGEVFRYLSSGYANVFERLVDPTDVFSTAVADLDFAFGKFFSGLSSDDAGGLRYLLHTNNVNYETLLSDVHGATNQVYVNAAMRPGVNKITFIRQQFDSLIQQWIPITNQFTDTYMTNSQPAQQSLERIVGQPDFLFSAGDTGLGQSFSPFVSRTGTTNWQNNGSPEALGPGVIFPPVKIIFDKFRAAISTHDNLLSFNIFDVNQSRWASFDQTANSRVFPQDGFVETNQFTVRFRLFPERHTFEWHPVTPVDGTALLQTSTNLNTWTTITTVTNLGGVIEWHHQRAHSIRYFRVITEE